MFTLAFMLISSFAFANTSSGKINKVESSLEVSFSESSKVDFVDSGCWVYVRFVNSSGETVGRGKYWDSECTIVGGRGITIVVAPISQ